MIFEGPRGEKVRVRALFDSGAQVGAIDSTWFEEVKRRMGGGIAPNKCLRMADGTRVEPSAHWEGGFEIEGVRERGRFEVFDSKGGWKVLFGKPLQVKVGAIHNMRADIVTLDAAGRRATLYNQNPSVVGTGLERWKDMAAREVARREASTGVNSRAIPPTRRVHSIPAREDTDAAGFSEAFIVEVNEDEETGKIGPTDVEGGGEESEDEFEDAVEMMEDEEMEDLRGDEELFVDAMEGLEDVEGEEEETMGGDEGGGYGDALKREASTGVKSSAIPPARRVLFDILPIWMKANDLSRVSRRTEAERLFLAEDASRKGSGEASGEKMTGESGREIGDTPTHEASTGVQSSAMPPAR
jgi:hypothetical protein